jgi:hypothetical protein
MEIKNYDYHIAGFSALNASDKVLIAVVATIVLSASYLGSSNR